MHEKCIFLFLFLLTYLPIYIFLSSFLTALLDRSVTGNGRREMTTFGHRSEFKPWAGHSLGTKAFSGVFNFNFHTCIETCRECVRLLHPLPLLMVSDAYNNSNLLCLLRLLCCSDHKNNQIKSTSVTSFSFSLSFSHCHRSNVCVCAALHTHSQVCCQLVSEIL